MVEIKNSLGSPLGHLNEVPEPRQQSKIDYPLDEILLLTINAVVSGCSEWQKIVDFGEDKLSWLRKYRPFSNSIPSHDTLNRAVSLIDSEAFEKMFVNWVNHNITLPAEQIAAYVRGHWGIENQFHYMLDVFWGEYYSRKQTANAATNFGTILRIAHNLVKSYPETTSVKRKLKKADRPDDYREKVLRFMPWR